MSNSLQLVRPQLPLGNLDAYLQQVNQIPLLTAEEERSLAERLQEQGDLQAAQQLILSHLRYVARVAKGYMGYGLPLADLIQEGTIGLMKAVKRFNPTMGVRLVSFAVHWIKAEIHEYIIKNWRIVKIATTKAQRKLFFNLRTAKKRLGWFTREEVEAVAHDLGVGAEEVRSMEARLNAQEVSFDFVDAESEHTPMAPVEYLEDQNSDPAICLEADNWQMQAENVLGEAWQQLDARSRHILEKRWLIEDNTQKATLQELAETFHISLERVRQIEKNAIKQLREVITESEIAY